MTGGHGIYINILSICVFIRLVICLSASDHLYGRCLRKRRRALRSGSIYHRCLGHPRPKWISCQNEY